MKTPFKTRLAALVASAFVTFFTVHLIASHALPDRNADAAVAAQAPSAAA